MKVEDDGTIKTNTTQLEDWLGQELSEDQIKSGLKRLYEMYPLYKLNIVDLFPILQKFSQRIEANLDKLETNKKMNVSIKSLAEQKQSITQIVEQIKIQIRDIYIDYEEQDRIKEMVELDPRFSETLAQESKNMDKTNLINNV